VQLNKVYGALDKVLGAKEQTSWNCSGSRNN